MAKYEIRKDGRTDRANCLPDSTTQGKPKRRVVEDQEFHPIP